MGSLSLNQRLQDLVDNIAKEQELLKDYEEVLRYEDEPRRIRKYRREIERQRESVICYQQEHVELKQELADKPSQQIQHVEQQLQQIDAKINILLSGQISISENLNQMRQDLLNRYDASERVIVSTIAQQLDETQLILTQRLLDAVEANQVSNPQMQQMLKAMEEHIPSLPPSQANALEVIKDPELDATHKLIVTIPLVPFFVDYEGELELGTGFNIKSAWEQLVQKLRRK